MLIKIYNSFFRLIYFFVKNTETEWQNQTILMRTYSSTLIISTLETLNVFTFVPFNNYVLILTVFLILNLLNAAVFNYKKRYLKLTEKKFELKSIYSIIGIIYIIITIFLFYLQAIEGIKLI